MDAVLDRLLLRHWNEHQQQIRERSPGLGHPERPVVLLDIPTENASPELCDAAWVVAVDDHFAKDGTHAVDRSPRPPTRLRCGAAGAGVMLAGVACPPPAP